MAAPDPSPRAGCTTRDEVLRHLADRIESVARPHPVRVGVDGPDASGKTTLADELSAVLRRRGREVIRASIDRFHRPRTERYRQGVDSPRGYYEDSFDHEELRRVLLDPLGPAGDRWYRTRAFDHRLDRRDPGHVAAAPVDAILLFDGVFLARRELADAWDFRICVTADVDEIVRRARVRDADLLGSAEEVERRYRKRYIPGQRRYFGEARPAETADVVLVNDDPDHPVLRLRAGAGGPFA